MSVTVKWGRERISFALPPPDTPLGAIRDYLAQCTHLPRDDFKLIHAGAVMKDDLAPISAYRIHHNSTIALIAHDRPLPPPPQHAYPPPPQDSEHAVIARIQAELSRVRADLSPDVETFLSTLPSLPNQDKEHLRLGELLLQSLLRLDGITTNHEWEDARRQRKDAVREVQALLDRLDGGWAARPSL